MIIDVINDNVFNTHCKHIAYAINTQGYNDSGFAGKVSEACPQLCFTGENPLGNILSAEAGGKTYHALVCHSLEKGGWNDTPRAIIECLNKIIIPDNEPIAVVLMGAGMIGQMSGADVQANTKAIHASKKKCILYTLEYAKIAIAKVLDAAGEHHLLAQ